MYVDVRSTLRLILVCGGYSRCTLYPAAPSRAGGARGVRAGELPRLGRRRARDELAGRLRGRAPMKKLFGVAQLEEARSCASSIKNMTS